MVSLEKYFFDLSGEHESMPLAEAFSCVKVESEYFKLEDEGPGYGIFELNENSLERIAKRISLTHNIGVFLGNYEKFSRNKEISGTFSLKVKRFNKSFEKIHSKDLIRKIGGYFIKDNDVDLEKPDNEIIIHLSNKINIYVLKKKINRREFDLRSKEKKPFFKPIVIHSRISRAAINLTEVKNGDFFLDPFCGTGGIALEASLMGLKVIVSDKDKKMVEGCLKNLEYYKIKPYDYEVIDFEKIFNRFDKVDTLVTDLPYGRSSSVHKENINCLYERVEKKLYNIVKNGKKFCVISNKRLNFDSFIKEEGLFVQRVNKSLYRYFNINRS